MIRLHVITEGQTEQRFIENTLVPHLSSLSIFADARCITTSTHKYKRHKGGLLSYQQAKEDIGTWLKQEKDRQCRFTTMFDLYALPDDFPGYSEAKKLIDPYERIKKLEESFGQDVQDPRFIPYIQLHEFEALLLASPLHLNLEHKEFQKEIDLLNDEVGNQNPELINDDPMTAPSKRISQYLKIYEKNKATVGPSVAGKIGLTTLREKCPHFNEWITLLENLSPASEFEEIE